VNNINKHLGVAVHEDLIFIAGGIQTRGGFGDQFETVLDSIEVFNVSSLKFVHTFDNKLPKGIRYGLAATTVKNYILFAGGNTCTGGILWTNVVEIFDVNTRHWSVAELSTPRSFLSATTVAGKFAVFAGGISPNGYSDKIDIFDVDSQLWYSSTLSSPGYMSTAPVFGNVAVFGGTSTKASISPNLDTLTCH